MNKTTPAQQAGMAALCLVLASPHAMAQSAPSTRVSQLMSTTTVEDATSTAAPTATVAPSYKLDDVLAVVLMHNPELRQAQQARIGHDQAGKATGDGGPMPHHLLDDDRKSQRHHGQVQA